MPLIKSSSKPKLNVTGAPAEPVLAWSFEAIGTAWWISVYDRPAGADLAVVQAAVRQRIEDFDATYSRFRGDSQVSKWATRSGDYAMPDDGPALFTFYRQLYDLTEGAVTPLIGQVLSDAGYDAAYSLQPKPGLASPLPWDEVLAYTDTTLTIKQPALLDFGAAGKGYLVDIISGLLESYGITAFCVDAGGDMRYRHHSQALCVGLENPADATQAIGVVELGGSGGRIKGPAGWMALCGSAGNRRKWDRFDHVIDPAKLESPRHLQAVWVAASSAMLADGLTTALYFTPPEKLMQAFTFAFAIVHTDGSLAVSPGFPGQFFTS